MVNMKKPKIDDLVLFLEINQLVETSKTNVAVSVNAEK